MFASQSINSSLDSFWNVYMGVLQNIGATPLAPVLRCCLLKDANSVYCRWQFMPWSRMWLSVVWLFNLWCQEISCDHIKCLGFVVSHSELVLYHTLKGKTITYIAINNRKPDKNLAASSCLILSMLGVLGEIGGRLYWCVYHKPNTVFTRFPRSVCHTSQLVLSLPLVRTLLNAHTQH